MTNDQDIIDLIIEREGTTVNTANYLISLVSSFLVVHVNPDLDEEHKIAFIDDFLATIRIFALRGLKEINDENNIHH